MWIFNPNTQEQILLHDAISAALRENDRNLHRPIFGPNIPVFVNVENCRILIAKETGLLGI